MAIPAKSLREEIVNELSSVTSEIGRLSSSVNWWNSAIVVMMVVAAIAATGLLITQYVAFSRAKQLSEVQTKLSEAKDRQSAADSKEKDQRIATALQAAADSNKAAGEANERAQKANERANALEVESLKLRGQLIAQGPREALLRGEIRSNTVEALKPFAAQRIDVRRSASIIMVNSSVVMSTPIGDDTIGLSQALLGVLKDAGWESPPKPLLTGAQGQGLKVEITARFSPRTLAAANGLVQSLRKVPLAVEGPLLDSDEQAKRIGTEAVSPEFDDNTIILTVLTHP